jgi:hypothetical protein
MASFACIAFTLERAADMMLGGLELRLDSALTRVVWDGQPSTCDDCGDHERFAVAARAVEIQYSDVLGSDIGTDLSDIPRGSARGAARQVALLFRQVGDGPHLEGDDVDKVALLMWEQARGVALARCP